MCMLVCIVMSHIYIYMWFFWWFFFTLFYLCSWNCIIATAYLQVCWLFLLWVQIYSWEFLVNFSFQLLYCSISGFFLITSLFWYSFFDETLAYLLLLFSMASFSSLKTLITALKSWFVISDICVLSQTISVVCFSPLLLFTYMSYNFLLRTGLLK